MLRRQARHLSPVLEVQPLHRRLPVSGVDFVFDLLESVFFGGEGLHVEIDFKAGLVGADPAQEVVSALPH